MSYAPLFMNAFLMTVVLVVALRRIAARFLMLDVPNERKRHAGEIPVVGGLAMFPAFLMASYWLQPVTGAPWQLFVGLSGFVALGALDDRNNLPPLPRLFAQFAMAAVMVSPFASIGGAPNGGAMMGFDVSILPAMVTFLVGVANAYNMADGLDGLAGGVASMSLLWLVLIAFELARQDVALAAAPLIFAILGFLVFNARCRWRTKASVFMGDAGSLMLGASIAFFVLALASDPHVARPAPLVALLWVCALPLVEMASLIVRRIWAGHSPMVGDRRHLHHLLMDSGLSPERAAALIVLASALLGAVGYAGVALEAPQGVILGGLVLVAAVHWTLVQHLERAQASRGAGTTAFPEG